MKARNSLLWQRRREITKVIVQILRERGPLGYNRLFDEVHARTKCGRNQFNRSLKEAKEQSLVLSAQSSLHRSGVRLEANPDAFPEMQRRGFKDSAEAIATYLFPFAELRETGSIEEQLAWYDFAGLLPFKMKIELTSERLMGRRLTAYGEFNKKGELLNERVMFEKPQNTPSAKRSKREDLGHF